ncbi:hypothetical protein QLQ12_12265 [Actinoplanes sp. NEAU-A12]|uniref:DUF4345 domain-containing protein n=1 Tax=Actinoplanes sandaracinus TaxID=3045177 RepID=A0ABT6WI35_9ACTN|nr:hypothetical protein [Actinoplanes sandaracinus]MDI6099367.1 hypothetical protein [Actinoplanes sandaracinus]
MSVISKQGMAAVLAASALVVGGWAAVAPASFYSDFPLPGRAWVSGLGPYNEHLVRDVGGLYLALFVLTAWAAARPSGELVRVTGLAWLVFGAGHLAFHSLHLEMFPTIDRIAMMVALGGSVLLAALLLIPGGAPWSTRGRTEAEVR